MRFAYKLAVLGIILHATPLMAQEVKPGDLPSSAGESSGPVVNGRHRQPTEAEVEARQRAKGESSKAIEARNRKEDQVIDDLYKELMTTPLPPLNEQSGQ